MSKITVEESSLSAVADSIRSKVGTGDSLKFPESFISAIQNIKTGITPTGTKNITQNGTHDVTAFASAFVDVPIPDSYIDKSKVTHFATGTVSNVTAGQKLTVSGIKDAKTGEAFDVKGLVAFVEPSSTQNYTVSGTGKPAVCMFYRNSEITSGVALAAYNAALTVRANTDFKSNEYIVISGNSFYFIQQTGSMWGLQASTKWRWIAWG